MVKTKAKRIAKIILHDEVNVQVHGLTTSEYMNLYSKYGIHSPNYFFNPKYKLGRWDGKIRFFSKTGMTFINLLSEIIPLVKQMGYKIKLDDRRKGVYVDVGTVDKDYFKDYGWEFAEHQVTAINKVLVEQKGIIIGGTGAGKTSITAAICDVFNKRANYKVLVIVPNIDLIGQTISEFREFEVDTGEYSGDKKELHQQTIVSTWQSLQNNKDIIPTFDAIIVDECHGVKGNVLKEILNEYGSKCVVKAGLTGTLPKHECDAMSVRITLGDVLFEIPAHELIAKEWLANLNLNVYQLQENFKIEYEEWKQENPTEKKTYTQFVNYLFDDYTVEKNFLKTQDLRNEFIVRMVEQSLEEEKGNTFILVNSVAIGKKFAKMIDGAVFVYGKDKKEIRQEIYKQFESNNNSVVIATFNLASTGLNIKRIFNLYMIDAGKSFIQVIQTIGRGLRRAHDKDSVNVYDVCSNLNFSKKHLRERKKFYNEQKYEFNLKKVDYQKYI